MRKYPCHEKKMHWHDWQSSVENIGCHSNIVNVSKISNDQDSDDVVDDDDGGGDDGDDVPWLDGY